MLWGGQLADLHLPQEGREIVYCANGVLWGLREGRGVFVLVERWDGSGGLWRTVCFVSGLH